LAGCLFGRFAINIYSSMAYGIAGERGTKIAFRVIAKIIGLIP
jgi:hypothetical protein